MTKYLIMPDYKFAYTADGRLQSCRFTRTISREDVIFGLTYWDTVEVVRMSSVGWMALEGDSYFTPLVESQVINEHIAPIYGLLDGWESKGNNIICRPVMTELLVSETSKLLTAIALQERTRSTFSVRAPFRPKPLYGGHGEVIEIKIKQAIPVARSASDSQRFLDWKLANQTMLRRLNNAISQLSSDIDGAKDPEGSLNDFIEDLQDAFSDISSRMHGNGFRLTFGDIALRVDPAQLDFWGFLSRAGTASALPALFLPKLAAGALGVAAGIQPAVSIARKVVVRRGSLHQSFPFEAATKLFS